MEQFNTAHKYSFNLHNIGESEYANIKKIVVSNQSGNAKINLTSSTVTIEIPGGVNL